MLKELFNKLFLSKYLGSVIRTGLAALGGFLVAKGIIPNAETTEQLVNPTTEIVIGILTWLLAQGSSIAQKKQ